MRYIRGSLGGNLEGVRAVQKDMNAFFWRIDENIVHHLRAESVAHVRERIAATHGDEIARRAVIRALDQPRTDTSDRAAA